MYVARRLPGNPIITPASDPSIGVNINGPSLIRAPAWLAAPPGRYFLYFADHNGTFIRLAFADELNGPWRIHSPGTVRLEQTTLTGHVASPDVHVDPAARKVVMYFHGPGKKRQVTRRAESDDGVNFTASSVDLGSPYFRVFTEGGFTYAIARDEENAAAVRNGGGVLLRSRDGRSSFEAGPKFLPGMRHAAVRRRGGNLDVFFSRIGDRPESILVATMPLSGDWRTWTPSAPVCVLMPQAEYEGADLPIAPSATGLARLRKREVRDPAIFEEDGRTYLVYSIAGESGLAIAELSRVDPAGHTE